jgi:hypothetical protein
LVGYFRAVKNWDLLAVVAGQLLAVIEFKAQVGPSFGDNFNNRTEEALGNATDLWAAYREGAFAPSQRPWLGYVFILEDCPRSQAPVRSKAPHFPVFPEFKGASYAATQGVGSKTRWPMVTSRQSTTLGTVPCIGKKKVMAGGNPPDPFLNQREKAVILGDGG